MSTSTLNVIRNHKLRADQMHLADHPEQGAPGNSLAFRDLIFFGFVIYIDIQESVH